MANETGSIRVLVVEDEWLIAASLADDLTAEGYAVEGPAPSLALARRIIDESAFDVGLLDVTLQEENSFPLARTLADKGIPFAFLSGYSTTDLPTEFAAAPLLVKPIEKKQLLRVIRQLTENAARRGPA